MQVKEMLQIKQPLHEKLKVTYNHVNLDVNSCPVYVKN